MIFALPLFLVSLVLTALVPRPRVGKVGSLLPPTSRAGVVWLLLLSNTALAARVERIEKRSSPVQTFPNGTNYVWTVQDTYEGSTFFE